MKYVQNKPNVFSALATLMILSFVVSLVALPNANIVQAADTQQSFSGSGQIASAHWVVGAVTIDAFFAEQLTTNTGETYSNGLYLKVAHSRGGTSENLVSLPASAISPDKSQIHITTQMFFTYITGTSDQSALHTVDLYWTLDPNVISSRDGYRVSSDEWVPALGEFYTTTADLYLIEETTGHHTNANRQHYVSEWADVGKTAPPSVSGGSGQIAMAHWEEQGWDSITIDAVFAEQLTTDTDTIIPNGLYIKVIHTAAKAISEEIISLDAEDISQDDSHIGISATMKIPLWGTEYDHMITIDWNFDTNAVLSEDDFACSFVTFVPASEEFYNAKAYIGIFGDASGFHPSIYESVWAVASSTAIETSGAVVALSGDAGIVAGNDAAYTVSVSNVNKLATVTLWFEVDGTYFAGKSFKGLNGFDILGNVQWTQNGNTWLGRVTLVNLDSNGISSNNALDIFEMVYSSNTNQLGTATVKLVKADLSGYNDNANQAVPIDSTITDNLIHTLINQYFSKYDTNKDGKIDQLDLTTVQLFYMAEEGDANWNVARVADINGDGRIDIEDLILILNNINWSSPLF